MAAVSVNPLASLALPLQQVEPQVRKAIDGLLPHPPQALGTLDSDSIARIVQSLSQSRYRRRGDFADVSQRRGRITPHVCIWIRQCLCEFSNRYRRPMADFPEHLGSAPSCPDIVVLVVENIADCLD